MQPHLCIKRPEDPVSYASTCIISDEPEPEPEASCLPSPPPMPSSETRKRRSESPLRIHHPRLPRLQSHAFWTSSVEEMPTYQCNPWDFYKPFLAIDGGQMLALCNHNADCRLIRTGQGSPAADQQKALHQVQHRNFVKYYECYCFEDRAFIVSEYVEFSVNDLLDNALYPTQREIAYIIGQVRQPSRSIILN